MDTFVGQLKLLGSQRFGSSFALGNGNHQREYWLMQCFVLLLPINTLQNTSWGICWEAKFTRSYTHPTPVSLTALKQRLSAALWLPSCPHPAESVPAVPWAGGQSQVIAEGCKQAADYGAQLRVSVQVPGRLVHRVTFCEQKVKESKRAGKSDSCRPNKQSLIFLGTHVYTFRCYCEWETSRPTKWQQESVLQAHELQSPAQLRGRKIILHICEGNNLCYKGIEMLHTCKCDLHISVVFETSVS